MFEFWFFISIALGVILFIFSVMVFPEIMALLACFFLTILCVAMVAFMVEDSIFDGELFDNRYERKTMIVKEISRTHGGDGYVFYYLSNNRVEKFALLDTYKVNVKTKRTKGDNISVSYNIRFSRHDRIIEDDQNTMTLTLPEGFKIKDTPMSYSVNDLKKRRVLKKECFDQVNYLNGQFKFYSLNNQLKRFVFYETDDVTLNFKNSDNADNKVCVDFDYYETYNHDIVNKSDHKPRYNVFIPNDFEVSDLKI